ncbi:MAG TPA: sn-glycerol-1-phosphate dehydrogenase [Candidatus Acutalibacter ornithocaccae]|uniref:Sn-glycerol-1-phosphate dehydrogenase n=1 Tax=Candidatus Acutalibacter ornithocaccae TaxID=2838416 RepID=A0A9D2RZM8_9FIRM|nr:sn-glycerol-1-phosphate dehydrogenase [Candidatus Acutalibacter ornithocaccae]
MASILDRPISQWAGMEYSCACGKSHKVDIQAIRVGSGVIQELPGILRDLGASHIFLVADNYTYEAAGRQVEQLLDQAGLAYHKRVFQTETPLVPNEYALGSVLAAMTSQDDMLLAVGSGTLNDVTKYVSARTGIPYVIAATAPSMDGYASTVAPTILDGFKTTLPAVYPAAIVADVDILKDAPMPMLTAGFGDIIGKFTSLADWRLSHQLNGEYYCPEVAGVIEAAVETCAANAQALAQREPQAIQAVTEALILSGLAMGMVGVSRPASGAEHQMAHYWEMDALRRGEEHPLHGNAVGVGTVLAASLYEMAAEYLPQGFAAPDKGQILACLQAAGSCADPKELGIRRELCLESLLHAMELRDRFTVQKLLEQKGKLSLCAQELVARYYGG